MTYTDSATPVGTVATASVSSAAATAAESSEGPRLQVVDDSPMHREMLSSRLTSLGYAFDLASDVSEAVARLRWLFTVLPGLHSRLAEASPLVWAAQAGLAERLPRESFPAGSGYQT